MGNSLIINIKFILFLIICIKLPSVILGNKKYHGVQPLSKINVLTATLALHQHASIKVSHSPLRLKGERESNEAIANVKVELMNPNPSPDDWVGVFSPAIFKFWSNVKNLLNQREYDINRITKLEFKYSSHESNQSATNHKRSASTDCALAVGDAWVEAPIICTSPIKYKFANYSSPKYSTTGNAVLEFDLINQRADFAFALFSGGLSTPKLVSVTDPISPFSNPKAPLYPRLAIGESWDIMTVTWTSGYDIDEAVPFVEWGEISGVPTRSPAGTLTYTRNQMCGAPARTVGWRDPGFIHTSFLKNLWPNTHYFYRMGHRLVDGKIVWSKKYTFKSTPFPGQSSLQRVVIFGDMGKAERDGSNEYADYQPGSLNTTDTLYKDIDNIDAIFLIGDMPYSNGYVSQWDQYTAQVEPVASTVPFMVASGNHERDSPNSGSFYQNDDSGGECGVPAETTFYVPAKNRAKFWYSADYGMFHFCIADTEHDWRAGSEQYKFLEECLASANRHKQPWLIFAGHRPLGYSSNKWYGEEGSFEEPMGRDDLQRLWQKYKVDMAFWGHVHNYERICPIYQNQCVNKEKSHYSGVVNGTIHVVAGGGGSHLSQFSPLKTAWSIYRDFDYGFVKLTAFNHSSLLFEYKKSSDGKVYDSFTISRDYKDVLACVHDGYEPYTLAS